MTVVPAPPAPAPEHPEGMIGGRPPIASAHGQWTLAGYDEKGFACLDEKCPACTAQALIINEENVAECLTCAWREATPAPEAGEEIPVRFVQMWLCDPCLDGEGGECHTPGCALWINRAPDIPLRDSPMVTILADPAPEVWDASVPPGGYVCSACGVPVESEPCPDHGAPAPEAAPVEALAAELVKLAHDRHATARLARGQRSLERAYQLEGEAIGLDAAAELVRERLAPQWAALAGRLAELQALIDASQPALASELLAERAANKRLAAQKSHLEARVTALTQALEREAAKDAELAKRDKALAALDRVIISQARSMYAAQIDTIHGDPNDATTILLEALDGWDGPQWNGAETGVEWLERTGGDPGA